MKSFGSALAMALVAALAITACTKKEEVVPPTEQTMQAAPADAGAPAEGAPAEGAPAEGAPPAAPQGH